MEEEGHQQEREGRVSPPPPPSAPSLLYAAFNQDSSFFASGTERGFRVYRCQPLKEMLRQESDEGGLSVVQMVDRYNIFAVVGGGPNPHYPPNKVMIWDDHQVRCIGELSFRSDVKSVRLRRDQIVIVLLQKIYVYNFRDLKLLHQIETPANPKGLCEVSHSTGSMVLVCPGLQKGQVRVEHYALKRTKFFTAHDSRIACFAITQDGMFVATASSKGTLIRIFNSLDGSLLQEVRRGADKANIQSLAFAKTAQWLAASSGKGTVHVFGLKVDSGSYSTDGSSDSSEQNLSSSLSFLKGSYFAGMLPKYFNSEWSLAQFHLQEGCEYIVSFGHEKDTIVIIGMDGSFYRCQFDPVAGGEMTQLEHHNFMKPGDAL